MIPAKLLIVVALSINFQVASFSCAQQNSENVVEANKPSTEIPKAKLAELRDALESIHELDQRYRHQFGPAIRKFGHDSKEVAAISANCKQADAANQKAVSAILDEYGWLSVEQVGKKANQTLFLVIQHADSQPATQEKYLPMIRQAVAANEASPIHLAMLEDRISVGKGLPQVYGSQITRIAGTENYEVAPILNPEKVDERRAKVGLEPMSDYIKFWGLNWELELKRLSILNSERQKINAQSDPKTVGFSGSRHVATSNEKGVPLFWTDMQGIARCIKAINGNEVYKTRLGNRAGCYAFPLVLNDSIVYVTRTTGTFVVAAIPEFSVISHNVFRNDETRVDGTPLVADGNLFLRSNQSLYCIGE